MFEKLPPDVVRYMGIPFCQIATLNKACLAKFGGLVAQEVPDSNVVLNLIHGQSRDFIAFIFRHHNFEPDLFLLHCMSEGHVLLLLEVRPETKFLTQLFENLKQQRHYAMFGDLLSLFTAVCKALVKKSLYLDRIVEAASVYPCWELYETLMYVHPYFTQNTTLVRLMEICDLKHWSCYYLAKSILENTKIDFSAVDSFCIKKITRQFGEPLGLLFLRNPTYRCDMVEFCRWLKDDWTSWLSDLLIYLCKSRRIHGVGALFSDGYDWHYKAIKNFDVKVFEALVEFEPIMDQSLVMLMMVKAINVDATDIVQFLVERCGADVTHRGIYSPLSYSKECSKSNFKATHEYIKRVHKLRSKIGYKNKSMDIKLNLRDRRFYLEYRL